MLRPAWFRGLQRPGAHQTCPRPGSGGQGARARCCVEEGRADLEGEPRPWFSWAVTAQATRTRWQVPRASPPLHTGTATQGQTQEDGVRDRTCGSTLDSGQCSPTYRSTEETQLRAGAGGVPPPPRWSRPLLPIAVLRTRGSHGASSSCHLQTHPGGSENHRLLAARWQVARCTVGWTCVSHGRTYGSFCERCPNRVSLTWPLAAPSLPWPAGPRRGVAPASSVSTGLGEGCSATKSRASQGAGGPWSSLPCELLLHRDKVGRWKLRGPVLASFCFFFFGGLGCSLRCLESGVAVVVAFRFVCWQIRRSFL